jgi:type IV pilus assembly protein PilE
MAARSMTRKLAFGARGFTLIEMATVMVVIAILTAIAIPNYTAYVARSNRSEARSQLLMAANWVERWRTQQGSYLGAALPAPALTQSPAQGTPKYTIALTNLTAITYTIEATPVGSMAGDICNLLRIDQTGLRTFTGGGGTQDLCWSR